MRSYPVASLETRRRFFRTIPPLAREPWNVRGCTFPDVARLYPDELLDPVLSEFDIPAELKGALQHTLEQAGAFLNVALAAAAEAKEQKCEHQGFDPASGLKAARKLLGELRTAQPVENQLDHFDPEALIWLQQTYPEHILCRGPFTQKSPPAAAASITSTADMIEVVEWIATVFEGQLPPPQPRGRKRNTALEEWTVQILSFWVNYLNREVTFDAEAGQGYTETCEFARRLLRPIAPNQVRHLDTAIRRVKSGDSAFLHDLQQYSPLGA